MVEIQPAARAAACSWGPRAYERKTPWRPGWAILAAAADHRAGILASSCCVGSGTVSAHAGGRRSCPAARAQLAVLGVWQATTIALTVAASAMFGGRIVDVLALAAPAAGAFVYLSAIVAMVALQMV